MATGIIWNNCYEFIKTKPTAKRSWKRENTVYRKLISQKKIQSSHFQIKISTNNYVHLASSWTFIYRKSERALFEMTYDPG